MATLERYEQIGDRLRAAYAAANARAETEAAALRDADARVTAAEEACHVAQAVAQATQQHAHAAIAAVVSRCLAAIFDEPYEFRIVFERARGKTEAQLQFVRDGVVLDDPLNQAGGGAVDIAAFALRLSALLLARPQRRRVLVLDEPFSRLRGREYRQRVASLLGQLAAELGVQFILNIDLDAYPEFEIGEVIRL